jgi:hypothetical protein
MRVWYIHGLPQITHERNLYLHKEIAEVWNEAGHKVGVFGPTHLWALRDKNAKCDVAMIENFRAIDAMEQENLDIIKQARFRVLITGGGWRRPDWVQRSLDAVKAVKADLVCLTHLPHEEKFKAIHPHVHYIGLGFDPKVFFPAPNDERFLGIVFCGNPAMGRRKNLEKLRAAYGQTRVDFRTGLTHKQMSAYLRYAKIGWNQIGRMVDVSCNLRVWEVAGCGTTLFCNRSRHVPLKDGVHYVAWDDPDDMMKKAAYWLNPANREEREQIAKQGLEEALRKHTWAHRALEYKALILDSV